MKKFLLILAVFTSLVAWQSCQYEWLDPVNPDIPDIVSYATDIQPIFDRSCNNAGCHASGGTSPDLSPANSYNDLFAEGMIDTTTPTNSVLYKKTATGGSMAKYTSPGDADLILKWIQDGALNN